MDEPFLRIWTVYFDPLVFPGQYVVRGFTIRSGAEPQPDDAVLIMTSSLENARLLLPSGLQLIPRSVGDDPKIVESWI